MKSKIAKEQLSDNLYGNLFEALVGAIVDKGHDYCERFCKTVITPHVNIERLEGKVMSYKSLMIEWCQKHKHSFSFDVFDDTGGEEKTHFGVRFIVDGKVIARARETAKETRREGNKTSLLRVTGHDKPKVMAKHVLSFDLDEGEPLRIIAIHSDEEDYRLVYWLNKILGVQLRKRS